MKITGLSGGECITYPLKNAFMSTPKRTKKPLFIHQCPNYDGSILALFPYNQNLDLQNLCDKLNAINWQELGFVCGGRFCFRSAL